MSTVDQQNPSPPALAFPAREQGGLGVTMARRDPDGSVSRAGWAAAGSRERGHGGAVPVPRERGRERERRCRGAGAPPAGRSLSAPFGDPGPPRGAGVTSQPPQTPYASLSLPFWRDFGRDRPSQTARQKKKD